ncbi:MAG: hypothetical protein KC457_33950, partial [Myxococcales bacterium]|nr:hypothetical protein [Myxococcales bacterium]
GLQNGEESGVDCGGPCRFCLLTELLPELDDFGNAAATLPRVALFADDRFAISYSGAIDDQARGRWFAADGTALGASQVLGTNLGVTSKKGYRIPIAIGSEQDRFSLLLPGLDDMSMNTDLFVLRHAEDGSELMGTRVNAIDKLSFDGDIVAEGDRLVVAWAAAGKIWLRRWDWSVANGAWIDIDPFAADDANVSQYNPGLSLGADGVAVLSWVHCTNGICEVLARRFDNDWLDPDPVVVSGNDGYFVAPRVARDQDGRVMVVWSGATANFVFIEARMLDEEFVPIGDVWTVQSNLFAIADPDVVALADGSFAVAWGDGDDDRVHLRRFVDAGVPKIADLGDEAPWPN